MMTTTPFANIANNISSVITGALDTTVTQIGVTPGTGALFPPAPFYVSVEFEVMKVVAVAGDVFTVSRGQDLTNPSAHPAGSIIEMRGNAALWKEIQSAVNKIENGTTPVPFNPTPGSIDNIELGLDVYRPSGLLNGGFEMWSRGIGPFSNTGSASTDSGYVGPDYWQISGIGTDTLTVNRDTVNVDMNGQFSASVVFTKGTGNGNSSINQKHTGYFASSKIGSRLTLTARVRTNVTNSVRIGIWPGFGSWIYSSFHPGNNTYQTMSVSAPIGAEVLVSGIIFAFNFAEACTAFLDNVSVVIGDGPSLYQPAQVPDIIPEGNISGALSRSNLLINGGFEIWQRGNGVFGATSATVAVTADMWYAQLAVGTGNLQLSRNSNPALVDIKSKNSLAVQYNAGSNDQFIGVFQQWSINADRGPQIGGQTVTFRMRVNSQLAGKLRLWTVPYVGAPRVYGAPNTLTNLWETLSLTVDLAANVEQAYFGVETLAGQSFTFYLDNATLVPGSVGMDYQPIPTGEEMNNCLAIYERVGAQYGFPVGTGTTITGGASVLGRYTRKAGSPSLTYTSADLLQIYDAMTATWKTSTNFNPVFIGLDSFVTNFGLSPVPSASGQAVTAVGSGTVNSKGIIVEVAP